MALEVETGTASTTSESYISLAEANTYHLNRGNTAWEDADDEPKEAALRKATQWIDGAYGERFIGYRTSAEQALQWPRYEAYDADDYFISETTIPVQLKHATAEAALRSLSDDLTTAEDLAADIDTTGRVRRVKKKAGPLETETEYFGDTGASGVGTADYPLIELLLSRILTGARNVVEIVRA